MSNNQHKALLSASEFFKDSAQKLLTQDGKLHIETLISSVARMSGSLMFRGFGLDQAAEPGTTVLSEQANIYGPQLMNVLFTTLKQLGHVVSEKDLDQAYFSSTHSQLSFEEAHHRLAPFFLKYCEVSPMPFTDATVAAAIATGRLVRDCGAVLDVEKGAAIAVYGFVEGTKTAPFPIERRKTSTGPVR